MTHLPKHPYRPRRELERTPQRVAERSVPGDLLRTMLFVLVATGVVRLVLTINETEPLTAVVRM